MTTPPDSKLEDATLEQARPRAEAAGPALLRGWLAAAARAHPLKPYLVAVEDGRALSYAALAGIASRTAGHLAARGIGADGRVVLLANNSLEHLAAYVGVLAAGATICTVHVEMNRSHFDAILPALKPRLVLYEEGLGLEALAARTACEWRPLGRWAEDGREGFFADLAAVAPGTGDVTDDERGDTPAQDAAAQDAVVFFTSGTSARPKGVVLTYRELLPNSAATAQAFGLGPEDRIYDYRSFNWASAQMLSALGTLSVGATLLLGKKFSRSRFFADIARWQATVATGNPTVLNMLLQGDDTVRGADLPRLRFITSSSAPLLVEEWRRFEARFGIPVAQGYGSSETGWIAGCTDRTRRHGSVGKPLAYLRAAIVDREGKKLAPGEIGYVEIGAYDDCAFRYIGEDGGIRVNAVGRLRTGDMGFLDPDGYLHLTGREKELIIRGGVNISPLEIDAVLMELAEIAEAATVGVSDRIYGEEVVASVVLQPGSALTADAILAHCAQRLPAFKAPKRIAIVARLPKTERGKLDRKAVNAQWHASQA
jgi:acyl-coenzyme A synthetase/AMP-(fatty) acid ligase